MSWLWQKQNRSFWVCWNRVGKLVIMDICSACKIFELGLQRSYISRQNIVPNGTKLALIVQKVTIKIIFEVDASSI